MGLCAGAIAQPPQNRSRGQVSKLLLQGDKTVLEEQLRHEHEARKAADADSANLSQQLQQEKIARSAAEQQVLCCFLDKTWLI